MQTITEAQFDRMVREGTILAMGRAVPKVIRAPDGTIIKLFRRKWNITNLLWPYADRFVNAARSLAQRGIPTVTVTGSYHVAHLGVDAVTYPALLGEPLRDRLKSAPDHAHKTSLLLDAARFIATLHDKGVYFRGLHFGNILVLDPPPDQRRAPDRDFALIDLSAAKFTSGPLRPRHRARNFKPLRAYPVDHQAVSDIGPDRFIAAYLDAADLSPVHRATFLQRLHRIDPRITPPPPATLPPKAESATQTTTAR